MKKILAVLVCMFILTSALAGCAGNSTDNSGKLKITVTVFPIYDWVREIMGEKFADANVNMLLDNGVDLHSYQPTADDLISISQSDIFIYVGGESDEWVEGAMKNISENTQVINLIEVLGDNAKIEEEIEGMEEGEEHDESEEHEEEYDEHIWLSLRNASVFCSSIEKALENKCPESAEVFKNNLSAYNEKLTSLDNRFKEVVENAEYDTLLFADRFPFRYLVDDYNLNYYAAFSGCSAESEASFETISFLAGKIDELNLKHIEIIEGSDGKIAETVINSTNDKNADIVKLDSLQSVTSADVNEKSYLSSMENNLNALKSALN